MPLMLQNLLNLGADVALPVRPRAACAARAAAAAALLFAEPLAPRHLVRGGSARLHQGRGVVRGRRRGWRRRWDGAQRACCCSAR